MIKAIEIKGKRMFTAPRTEGAEDKEKNKNVGEKMKDERQKTKDKRHWTQIYSDEN